MTLIIGCAVGPFAILAADTRLNLTFRASGNHRREDTAGLELQRADGSLLVVGSEQRKLRRTGFGWAAGAGHFLAADAMLRWLVPARSGEPAALAHTIRAARECEATRIQAEMGTPEAELDRTTVVYTWRSEPGFSLNALTFAGQQTIAGAQFAAITPPELSPARVAIVNQTLASELIAPHDISGIAHNLRVIGRQFSEVAGEAESVGGLMELGLLTAGVAGIEAYFIQQHAADLIDTDATSLRSRLRAV